MTDQAAVHRPAVGSHRVLGEGVGAALIGADGEIDWWCPDRFDAEPMLWSLLDARGGRSRWSGVEIAEWDPCPAGPMARTAVRVGNERVDLWDGLIAAGDGSVLVRLMRSRDGPLAVGHEFVAGGFDTPATAWQHVLRGVSNGLLTVVGCGVCEIDGNRITFEVKAATDSWSGFAVASPGAPPVPSTLDGLVELLRAAEQSEERRMARLRLPRRHASRAVDALRVLHALTDPSTGAPVAAPTTSLPEAPGGGRQFDYRYTWLRDSALGLGTAVLLGHLDAGARCLDFVAELLDRNDGHLHPVTTTTGGPVPPEREIREVAGWAGSRPVRVGNAARDQRQLDAVASVIDAVWTFKKHGGQMTRRRWATVDRLATLLAEAPFEPTSGIWERRDPARLVSEEIARWIGLDRALRLRRRCRPWLRRPAWHQGRQAARHRVESALDPASGRLPQTFDHGDTTPDAAALQLALARFWPRRDERLRRLVIETVTALQEGSFLRRYPPADDGFDGVEATFLPASWWAIAALAVVGDLDAAWARADDLCAHLPPLQPEEWDVQRGEPLGNTPLLWTHMEAARCLYLLQREQLRRRIGPAGVWLWSVSRAIRLRMGRGVREPAAQRLRARRAGTPA